jgi:hypothetical protein
VTRLPNARRAAAALAATSVLSIGLVACGDDSGSDASDSASGSHADDAVPAAALDGLSEGDEVEPGEFVDIISEGVKSSTTAKTKMKMSLGEQGEMTGEGAVDYTTSPPEVAQKMTMDALGQTMEYDTRVVDGIMYLSLGKLSQGKFWKIDPSDPDGPLAGLGLDTVLKQTDPIGQVAKMEPGIEKVTYAGQEDVDGRELDHYELTMDVAKAYDAMGGQLPQEAEKALPESLTYDIWLDDENRFAQMDLELPVMGSTVSMEMSVTDWGAEVDIEAPPADEVTEMPDLNGLMGGLGGQTPSA